MQQHAVTLLSCVGGQTCWCSKVSWQAAGRSHTEVTLLASSGAAGSLVPLGSPAGMDPEHPTGHVLVVSSVSRILALARH